MGPRAKDVSFTHFVLLMFTYMKLNTQIVFFFLIPKLVSGRRTNSFDYTLHFSQIKIDTWVTDNSFLSIPLGFSFIFTAQKESPFTLFSTLFWS